MQTDDTKGDYVAEQEIEDAMEMLGKGYDQENILKELPSVMSGFTPAPDVLIAKYGFVTALVWGKMWRYCQMSDGVCRAKLETLAEQTGMSVRTIIRHSDILVSGGYLKDMTPNLKNKPHIYADTGKIRIKISIEATMTESHSTVTLSHSHHDRESLEESIKKPIKDKKIKTGASAKPATPPEIKLFREVTERYPNKINYENVVALIQGVSKRVGHECTAEDLRPFYAAWCANGWNKLNLAWLSYAEHGELPSAQKKNSYQNASEPKAFDGIRKFLEAQNVNAS